ncbi:MAG: MerR family DNA-binding transcriptional regulator [Candidatus Atribacteria bacterium]|nr:MerR family DNA-binding transcriptional regulator [Candidatus Atribacteria bacterium]
MESQTIREAAQATGMSEATIRHLIKIGKLSAEKEKGTYRIPVDVVQSYLADKGKSEKKIETPEIVKPKPTEDTLYQEMKDRIKFLEEELKNCHSLVEKLTSKAFPADKPPDNRGAIKRMVEWFVGKKE